MLHLTRATAAWGFSFRFASDDAELVSVVEYCYRDLPPTLGACSLLRAVCDRDGYDLSLEFLDGRRELCTSGRSGPALIELVAWEVNRRARATAVDGTVLHAAVFAGSTGAVAVCGSTRSGKSTLAAAVALRGWRHLSDDLGHVDVSGLMVAPYARPVLLRVGGRQLLRSLPELPQGHDRFFDEDWLVPASALGAQQVHQPQPLVALVFLEWGDKAALAPLGRAATLHRLTQHSATLANRGADGFADLADLAARAPGHTLTLGTPDAALDLLAPLIGA